MTSRVPTALALTGAQLALGVLSSGCEQRPPIRYETEHLRIGTDYDAPVCRGNRDHLERVVTSLEERLDTKVTAPIEVYLWGLEDPGWCPEVGTGCFENNTVYSSEVSVDHELAHIVIATLGDPAAFWDEGSAEALQSDRTLFGLSAPIDDLNLETARVNYHTAGHFSRWLIESRGIDSFRQLLRSSAGALEAFEGAYDLSFEAAQEQYFNEAPHSYGALIACEHPALPQTDELTWSETLEIDCEAEHVYSTPDGMGMFRVLTIEQRGYYVLSTSAELGTIARCDDEDLEHPVTPDDPKHGDVPPTTNYSIYQYIRTFGIDGEETTLDLAPGRYEIGAGYYDHEARTAQLTVEVAAGPIPQLPETAP